MELKEKAKELPKKSGVYLMRDSIGNIIYIGKSKSLRNRVSSYFTQSKNLSSKIQDMVSNIDTFDYILTDTELEALLLESRLIKENKPMYNRQLKNTKRYVYIKITWGEDFPRVLATYDREDDDSMYFGPYPSLSSVESTIGFLKDTFTIIQCNNPANSKSVCLNYHLKRCGGICEGLESKEKYRGYIENIIDFLKGNNKGLLKELESKMKEAASNLNFDKASKCRDQLAGTKAVLGIQKVLDTAKGGKEVVLLELIDNTRVKIFYIKGNKLINRETIDFKGIMKDTNTYEYKGYEDKYLNIEEGKYEDKEKTREEEQKESYQQNQDKELKSKSELERELESNQRKITAKERIKEFLDETIINKRKIEDNPKYTMEISKENIDEIIIISSYIKKEKERTDLKLIEVNGYNKLNDSEKKEDKDIADKIVKEMIALINGEST